ncbi:MULTISPECIES: hypothetical protein [unclassified Pseudomonas]|uniref:hypothetical protein n=1 Tax=unclassified Pseudomonas TaxID=196821 RepID=UPI00075887E3|nr:MULTISPECIES: hypothetical protein [unclassified Pseudomonas]KVV04192.1 hypothetical protein AP060_02347 [Pseudomonas sp. TAD18]KVV05974.1 hypothetical protein AP059_02670 [Pseudomonas sp. TAA207]
MHMRLIYADDREELGVRLSEIEAPFFAKFEVEDALCTPFPTLSLFDIETYGRQLTHEEIVDAVEAGDILLVKDDPFSPLSQDTFNEYSHITGRGWTGSFHMPVEQEKPPLPEAEPIFKPQPQEPGFYVVPKSTTGEKLKAALFSVQNPTVMSKFDALNPNLGKINAGTMIVLSDPNNLQCTREEAMLMQVAAKANAVIKEMTPEEADFMVQHRNEIQTFTGYGSTSIGVGEAMFAKHLDDIKHLFKYIEALHVRTFEANGNLNSPDFFAERKRLLTQLDSHLTALTRKSIGFPDHPNLKSALGISSRSLIHRWTAAGGADHIPGYATHIEGVSKAAKYLKYGGWIGTGIGGGASYVKVQNVCSAGKTEKCRKIRFTESGGFLGTVAGGAGGGYLLSGAIGGGLCAGLTVATGGVGGLVCGIVVVGAGSFLGGFAGGMVGEIGGEVIYESAK